VVNAGLACNERIVALGKEIMGSTTNRGDAVIHGGDGALCRSEWSSFVLWEVKIFVGRGKAGFWVR
jgi:hypothetical protein